MDGWQQGWLLDESATGPVTETLRAPSGSTGPVWWSGLLTFVGLLVLVLFWTRRPPTSAAAAGRHRAHTRVAGGPLATTLALGAGGRLDRCRAGASSAHWPRSGGGGGPTTAWAWSSGFLVVAAAFYYAFHGWGSELGWGGDRLLPQLAVVLAVALAGVVRPDDRAWRSRIAGSSTKR